MTQVFTGLMLSDATLNLHRKNSYLAFKQSLRHHGLYLLWVWSIFFPIVNKIPRLEKGIRNGVITYNLVITTRL